MKNLTIKVLMIFLLFFFISEVSALDDLEDEELFCNATEKVELNTLSSYVTVDFEFNEETELFNLVLENISPYLSFEFNGVTYMYSNKGIVISNISEGTNVNINVIASEYSNCYKENINTIRYEIPYINRFMNTKECKNNPRAEICNTKFLNYKMTYAMFQKLLIEKKEKTVIAPKEEVVEEVPWYQEYLVFFAKYGIQVILFILGFSISFIIGHNIVKKVNSKF